MIPPYVQAGYPTNPADLIGLWLQLLFMFMIYSYPLYKENHTFRFAEHTYLAIALAIAIIVNLDSLFRTQLSPIIDQGRIILLVPVILGLCMYLMMYPKYRWVSRYPIAILVGSALGLGMSSRILPNLQKQVLSVITTSSLVTAMDWFNFFTIAVGTILIMMYFIFTYEKVGVMNPASKLARWFIMIGLGTHFGNTVLFRFTMLSGRAQFVLQVLKLVPM